MGTEDLLDRAAPALAARDEALTADLRRLAADNERYAARRRRLSTRVGTAATVVVAVLGVGGVAAAGGLLSAVSFPWSTESGHRCELDASAALRVDGEGELLASGGTPTEQRATLAAARSFLARLDLGAIDRGEAAGRWLDHVEERSAVPVDRATLERKFTGADLETHAILYDVEVRLDRALRAEGHDPTAIMTTIASACGE